MYALNHKRQQTQEATAKEIAMLLNPAAVKRGRRWLTCCPARHHVPGNLSLTLMDTPNGIGFHCKEGCSGMTVKVLVFKTLARIASINSERKTELRVERMERSHQIRGSWTSIFRNLKNIYAAGLEWLAWQIDELANVMAGDEGRK